MNLEERLTTLLYLFVELTRRLVNEVETGKDPEKIKEYNHQLQQIDKEVKRIEKMRSYK